MLESGLPIGRAAALEFAQIVSRARILRNLGAANDNLKIALEPPAEHAAAFIDGCTKTRYLVESTLGTGFEKYALAHENMHAETPMTLPLARLSAGRFEIISRLVGEDLAADAESERILVEGFNDWLTQKKVGPDRRSAYFHFEVPLAQKLEKYSKQLVGESLLAAFKHNQPDEFVAILGRLAAAAEFREYRREVAAILVAA